ncbi:MAG: Crp/Fnr family transcriptional regulator [Firmicutes bacterium]|nr:Crp/Fnr family transcriptional regulator [Bacillota bacterium]
MVEDRQFIAAIPLFADLPPAALDEVARVLHERHYPKGATIFRQGDPGEAIYFLREGRVKVYRVAPDGQEQIIAIWEPPAAFGLVVALDQRPYPATAEAVEPSVVWMMRIPDYRRLQQEHPHLQSRVLLEVADRLRGAQDRIHSLATRDLRSRLAEFLLRQARERGRRTDQGWEVDLSYTHEELGGLLGASRETITRALAELRRSRALEMVGNRLILNEERLRAWVED